MLTASDEPFFCLMCSREIFKRQVDHLVNEINCLKTELKIIPTMQASIEALKEEIVDLRKMHTVQRNCHQPTSVSYANAVMKSSRQAGVRPNSNPNQATSPNKVQAAATNATSASGHGNFDGSSE